MDAGSVAELLQFGAAASDALLVDPRAAQHPRLFQNPGDRFHFPAGQPPAGQRPAGGWPVARRAEAGSRPAGGQPAAGLPLPLAQLNPYLTVSHYLTVSY